MEKVKKSRVSKLRVILGMMLSPASVLKSAVAEMPWGFSLAVSSAAFCLFFLQTGLDLYKTGQKEIGFVILSAAAGAAYGLIFIPFAGAVVWTMLKLAKSQKELKWVVSSFCLSYSGALVYGITGILFSLAFAWKTSVAFGATGVLWAAGPMIVAIRATTDGKNVLSIPIATAVCGVVLLSWSMFGQL